MGSMPKDFHVRIGGDDGDLNGKLKAENETLQAENAALKKCCNTKDANAKLQAANETLQAENVGLKNGKQVEGLR